ncbi:transposase/IS protein [Thermoplasmatales archaeon]|nr:transposase/IS protein [Thermoplasmatales archaeon]QRF76161.1 transposase/IS protein [Thermoplasmatales archaeon]
MDPYERVHESLITLGLDTIEHTIDNYLENARDRSVIDVLDHLLSEEVKSKRSKRYETKLKYAGFPFRKTMEEFDFSFQKSIDMSVIDDLMTLRFVHNRENLVFLGPPGVGKTHLSVALGMRALQSDVSTYYISAVKLVQSLRKEYLRDRLNILLRSYSRYALMIVDEIGYLPLNREESNLMFQLVSHRYEKSSTIFTSNKSFSEWGEVMGDQVMASAILDRILHHCTVLNIKGESYRLKDRRKGNPPPYKEK